MEARAAAAAQLGRSLRSPVEVCSSCHLGLPVVVAVPPLLEDGTPFPTRYWLTCPLAQRRVGRLEGAGGVKAMERKLAAEAEFDARMQAAHRRYAAARDALLPDDAARRPRGGVGGLIGPGVKCLHAHYADTRAGNDNPVGELVAPWVEPLDCTAPCVIENESGEPVGNPHWREPQ